MSTNKTKIETKINTEWDLATLFYKSPSDPKLEADVVKLEKLFTAFAKKYTTRKDYLKNEHALFHALTDFEELAEKGTWKPVLYLNYATDLNSTDAKAESLKNMLIQRLTNAGNKIVFFDLSLGKIDSKIQQKFLKSKKLEHFHYMLTMIFNNSKHMLTEAEEKIVNLKYLPSRGLWTDGVEKLISSKTVAFKGKKISLPEASGQIPQLPAPKRRKLHRDITLQYKDAAPFAESEINALYTDKKIMDELRGFKQPYSASILGYQNDEKSIMNLVETSTKNFKVSHRFYELKAKLLKLKSLEYADRAADVGTSNKKVSFEDSLDILRRSLGRLPTATYLTILDRFIKNGHIDVYPKTGKRGGAYCSSSVGTPTLVLLNHTDSLDSVMTFGHEMGHAFHSELSKTQSPIYQDYTISVAETASTFFENIVFEEIFETLSPKEKVIALHDRLNDDIATVFRQIACFNFELELHQKVRAEGFVTKEVIAEIHNKNMSAYLGPKFKMQEDDGYMFVGWSHIRNYFYVYSYAYGQLISKALYRKYKEDPQFIFEVERFLKAGGSKSPEAIFKEIGIDTTKPDFFEAGIKQIELDIISLEKAAKEAKMI